MVYRGDKGDTLRELGRGHLAHTRDDTANHAGDHTVHERGQGVDDLDAAGPLRMSVANLVPAPRNLLAGTQDTGGQ
jgi:hypothetical protein